MPEYVYDEAFEHRLERVLREIGNEAVIPFDPYETTQLIITNSRIGGVPVTAISADQIAQLKAQQATVAHPTPLPPPRPTYDAPTDRRVPVAPPGPPGPPPGYYDEPSRESRRWPLLLAIALLIAALVFAGFATGFIKMPTNFGITVGSPAPIQTTSTTTSGPSFSSAPVASPTPTPTPKRTKKPRRSPRPRQTQPPAATAAAQQTSLPTEPPTALPTQPTAEPAATQDAAASPN